MRCFEALAIISTLLCGMALAEDEYSFDLSEIEEKPWHIGGYLEFRPVLFGLDNSSMLSKLKLYDRDKETFHEEYNFRGLLDGSYEKGPAEVRGIVNTDLRKSYLGWSEETALYEGYLSLRPSTSFAFSVGKKTLKWGKGYAWNPVAFLDRPKNPNDPDLAREGFVVVSADYIRSFDGPLKTFSFTPVLMPVYDHINSDFGELHNLNFAGKTYFLFYDTDIDFILLAGDSKPNRYGMDFSRNITANFEMHGEFALIDEHTRRYVNADGTVTSKEYDAKSYLFGIRYLTESDTTCIFEFLHDARGFSESHMEDYFAFIDRGYDTYLASRDDFLLKEAPKIAGGNYNRRNPMRDYLYLRASQKEPFDILYFTPSITGIYNINDESFSIGPELLYTRIENLELRLKSTFLAGDSYTEFGEKQNDYRIEFRVRYFF